MIPTKSLPARAARLFPDAPALQRKWIAAVAVVRGTKTGWVMDRPVPKEQPRA
jgi:hypothetical protein